MICWCMKSSALSEHSCASFSGFDSITVQYNIVYIYFKDRVKSAVKQRREENKVKRDERERKKGSRTQHTHTTHTRKRKKNIENMEPTVHYMCAFLVCLAKSR